jgi:predicted transposase YbfD/YdcC
LPPPDPKRVATSVNKGHGRVEKRTLRTTSILTLQQKWPGLKQGFELRRERRLKGKTTVEVVYGITSLSPDEADAEKLLVFVRDHWRIENKLHYVRDVTLGEDACRVHSGSAPQVLAALRNCVIHLLAGVEADSCQEAIEELQIEPNKAMDLIGAPHFE